MKNKIQPVLWNYSFVGFLGLMLIWNLVTFWAIGPSPLERGQLAHLFLRESRSACNPEPLEQLRFLCTLIFGFIWAIIPLFFLNKLTSLKLLGSMFSARVIQAFVILACAVAWSGFGLNGFLYFSVGEQIVTVTLALLFLLSQGWFAKVKISQFAAWTFCFIFAGLLLGTGLFNSNNLGHAFLSVRDHLPFTFGEFSAAYSGKTALVDFFPQYQNLIPLLSVPYFQLFGLSVQSFTGLMALFSATLMLSLFFSIKKLVTDPWLVAFFFISVILYGHYSIDALWGKLAQGAELERMSPFNYFALFPLRGLALGVALFGLMASFKRLTSEFRVMFSVVASTLMAFNNLDWGLPILFALLVAYLMLGASQKQLKKRTVVLALSIGLGFSIFILVLRLNSGVWPALSQLIAFQSAFALFGFNMLPAPTFGPHWVIFATYLAGLITGFTLWGANKNSPFDQSRLFAPVLLVFSSIAGLGCGAYFMGRSHVWVLPGLFLNWAFVLAQLCQALIAGYKLENEKFKFGFGLNLKRGSLFLCLCLLLLGVVRYSSLPEPLALVKRFEIKDDSLENQIQFATSRVKEWAQVRERVAIVYPYADLIAERANVKNVFPFVHSGSLVLRSQLELAMAVLSQNEVVSVFGDFAQPATSAYTREEFSKALLAAGFKPIKEASHPRELNPFWAQTGMGEFQVWKK